MERLANFDATSAITALVERFGRFYDPKEHADARSAMVEILLPYFPDQSHRELSLALDGSIGLANSRAIDWWDIISHIGLLLKGTWHKVGNGPGFSGGISGLFLMTDGTVLAQEYNGSRFKKLTPDTAGSYINGTWSDIAPMHTPRLYYASAVLRDGRLLVCGGEYEGSGTGTEGNKCEVYDPLSDSWTSITPPAGWSQIGDAACALLPDGRFLLGNLNDTRTAIFDPATNAFSAGPAKRASSSEESWVLMPDGTVVTIHTDATRSTEKYVLASNSWVDAGSTPFVLPEISSKEIGAGVLLPDGRAFFVGATNQTALYSMPANPANPGTWSAGPSFPNDANGQMVGAKDAPACLLTNGRVLISVGPVDGVRGDYLTPNYFYEFNGTSLVRANDPPIANAYPYNGRMLLLPNGQVLFGNNNADLYVYSYFSFHRDSWRPTIDYVPPSMLTLFSHTLSGTQLNGLSQAVGYGDDFSAATNYPLVRLTSVATGHVTYARTFNHSTMAVATGLTTQSTNFRIPWGLATGDYDLVVVANGIPSVPRRVHVQHFRFPFFDAAEFNRLFGSLADGDLWVWGPNGPVPVDPWGPDIVKEAARLREQLVTAFDGLKRLGLKVHTERLEVAAALAGPLVFENDEDEDADEQVGVLGAPPRRGSRGTDRSAKRGERSPEAAEND